MAEINSDSESPGPNEPEAEAKKINWPLISFAALVVGVIGPSRFLAEQGIELSAELTTQASTDVTGFENLNGGVGMLPLVHEGVQNMEVTLVDGRTCDIQYVTRGRGVLRLLIKDEARIVNLGTCPPSSEATVNIAVPPSSNPQLP